MAEHSVKSSRWGSTAAWWRIVTTSTPGQHAHKMLQLKACEHQPPKFWHGATRQEVVVGEDKVFSKRRIVVTSVLSRRTLCKVRPSMTPSHLATSTLLDISDLPDRAQHPSICNSIAFQLAEHDLTLVAAGYRTLEGNNNGVHDVARNLHVNKRKTPAQQNNMHACSCRTSCFLHQEKGRHTAILRYWKKGMLVNRFYDFVLSQLLEN